MHSSDSVTEVLDMLLKSISNLDMITTTPHTSIKQYDIDYQIYGS